MADVFLQLSIEDHTRRWSRRWPFGSPYPYSRNGGDPLRRLGIIWRPRPIC